MGEGAHAIAETPRAMAAESKRGQRPRSNALKRAGSLLDLGLAEFDVLARDRIVLLLHELVGHGARILLGDIIEAGIRRGNELDLDGDRFGHVQNLKYLGNRALAIRPAFAAQPSF